MPHYYITSSDLKSAENPANAILYRTSDNLATNAAKPQTPRGPHAVRPSLFGVPIPKKALVPRQIKWERKVLRVREPDDICDIENEGQNDDGDKTIWQMSTQLEEMSF